MSFKENLSDFVTARLWTSGKWRVEDLLFWITSLEFFQIQAKCPQLKGFFSIGFAVAAGLWDVWKAMCVSGMLPYRWAGNDLQLLHVPNKKSEKEILEFGKGQGCILSPCLFNLYAEYIMQNAWLDEAQGGAKVAARNINNLSYADDTTFTAEKEEELKSLLTKVKEESEKLT